MTNYAKTTNFTAKDALPAGDANKIARGLDVDVEFDAIAIASATKADLASPTLTGNVVLPAGNAASEALRISQLQSGEFVYAADTGSTDAYAITLAPTIAAYTDGMIVAFKAGTKNTGPATININSVGAKAITKPVARALESGDIQANQYVILQYDGTGFEMHTPVPVRGEVLYAADTASDDDYLVVLTPTAQAYYDGMLVSFKATTINTGAVTLNVDGLGAKAILKRNDLVLEDGDIEAGQLVIVQYDGTQFQMQSQVATAPDYIIQRVNTQTGATATGATGSPILDDTIPQQTEGDQYMTRAITPTVTSNKLKIDVVFIFSHSAAGETVVSLFQDATAGALAGTAIMTTAGELYTIAFTHYMTADTISSTTFKVRAGQNGGGTLRFNGIASGRRLGGVLASSITITESTP